MAWRNRSAGEVAALQRWTDRRWAEYVARDDPAYVVPEAALALRQGGAIPLPNLEAALRDPLQVMDWVNLYALAVNEENAAGGRVMARSLLQFPHNYNHVSRTVMYGWINPGDFAPWRDAFDWVFATVLHLPFPLGGGETQLPATVVAPAVSFAGYAAIASAWGIGEVVVDKLRKAD